MLKTRIITAVALLSLFSLVLWAGSKAFAATAAIITGLIIFEFLTVSLLPSRRGESLYKDDAFLYSAMLTLPGIALVFFGDELAFYLTAFAITTFLIRECFLFESSADESPSKEVLSAFAIALLYPFLFGLMFIVSIEQVFGMFHSEAWRIIVWFVALVVVSDTGAYFGGKLLGKNKLAPRISPSKTVEGAIAGFICVITFAQLLSEFLKLTPSFLNLIVVAIMIGILAPIGDLVESWVKRLYGVKDMGHLLPGHGGIFDRVDSYIFASLALFFLKL